MIKRNIILFIMLMFSIGTIGQTKIEDIEKILPTVVYIYDAKIQKQQINGIEYEIFLRDIKTNNFSPSLNEETGTGFFVNKDLDQYLVTAEHVAKSTTINTLIVVSSPNDSPIIIPLKDLLDSKYYDSNNIKWINHPNADVSVLPLNFSKIKDTLKIDFIPYDLIYNELKAPCRQRTLSIYGYPLSLGIGNKISPISKIYNPSSGLIDMPRFDTKRISTFFLIDDPIISGFSGGPVVALPQELKIEDDFIFVKTFWIVGLVHGTIAQKNEGGIGAIVPSKYIVETIDMAPGYNGKFLYKYPNGKAWSEVIFKNGLPWTVLSNFDKNGNSQEKGTLIDGNGTRNIYDEDSKLQFISHYKNGRIVKQIETK